MTLIIDETTEVIGVYDEYVSERYVAMQDRAVMVKPTIGRAMLERLLVCNGINPSDCDIRRRPVRYRVEVLRDALDGSDEPNEVTYNSL